MEQQDDLQSAFEKLMGRVRFVPPPGPPDSRQRIWAESQWLTPEEFAKKYSPPVPAPSTPPKTPRG